MKEELSNVGSGLHDQEQGHSVFKVERTKTKAKTEIMLASNELIQDPFNEEKEDNPHSLYATPKSNQTRPMNNEQCKRFLSPICSYYNSSQKYLQNLLKENDSTVRSSIENSHNFIEKDSFIAKNNKADETDNFTNEIHTNQSNGKELLDFNEIKPSTSHFSKSQINSSSYFPSYLVTKNNKNSNQINRSNSYTYEQKSCFNSNNTIFKEKSNSLYPLNSEGISPVSPPQSFNYQHIDQYTTEMFGRKGWICTLCNNFNYEVRNRCNRCKNDKSPKIIRASQPNNLFNPLVNQGYFNINPLPLPYNQDNNCNMLFNNIAYGPYNNINSQVSNNATINKDDNDNSSQYSLQHNFDTLPLSSHNIHLIEHDTQPNTQPDNKPAAVSHNKPSYAKTKGKPFSDSVNDWICSNCNNLNFSFRNSCNRCQIPRADSDKQNIN